LQAINSPRVEVIEGVTLSKPFPRRGQFVPSPTPTKFRFGLYELDAATGELRKSGALLKLQPQPLRVLELLVQRSGQLVTREEIQQHLWKDSTFVDFEHGINFSINQIRATLADNPEKPRYVETLPRRGYRFISPVDSVLDEPSMRVVQEQGGTQAAKIADAKNTRRRIIAGTLSALVIVLASLIISRIAERGRSTVKIRSVAVLPLENVSGNTTEDYFADGMTDDLITELGRIQTLRVISRTSVMRYKGVHMSLPQIAQELNVDAILEGTVMRSGDQIRITAQLIQASPEKHLWAHGYQRDFRDVLGLQDEIASAIALQVQSTLSPPERTSHRPQHTAIPAAYESYWKGEYFLDKLTPESSQKALNYFQDAIAKDPEYVAAYTKLAGLYQMLGNIGVLPKKESQSKAKLALDKALALDPQFGPAYAGKGWTALLYDLDFATAGTEFNRAVELSPNAVEGREGLANYYAAVGDLDRAVLEITRARDIDPLSFLVNEDVCRTLYFARRFEQALAQCKATLEMDPELRRPLLQIGCIYSAMGEEAQAASTFIQFFQTFGEKPATLIALTKKAEESGLRGMWDAASQFASKDDQKQDPFGTASAYTYAGRKDKALTWLERAFDERSFGIAWLAVDPSFDSLHSESRYQILAAKLRIPQK
jgi:TolB-like protein/DNA-binding winged helix-turn-helix (wHTH) protein/tetratricopeptide (TPR) repeat protein